MDDIYDFLTKFTERLDEVEDLVRMPFLVFDLTKLFRFYFEKVWSKKLMMFCINWSLKRINNTLEKKFFEFIFYFRLRTILNPIVWKFTITRKCISVLILNPLWRFPVKIYFKMILGDGQPFVASEDYQHRNLVLGGRPQLRLLRRHAQRIRHQVGSQEVSALRCIPPGEIVFSNFLLKMKNLKCSIG